MSQLDTGHTSNAWVIGVRLSPAPPLKVEMPQVVYPEEDLSVPWFLQSQSQDGGE